MPTVNIFTEMRLKIKKMSFKLKVNLMSYTQTNNKQTNIYSALSFTAFCLLGKGFKQCSRVI